MNAKAMTAVSGYVPQFDVFIGTLTVIEHLTFLVNSILAEKIVSMQVSLAGQSPLG